MEKTLKNRILGYIAGVLIFIILAIYLTHHIFFVSAKNIVTEIAQPVTEEVTVSCDGYIMRNEAVIDKSMGGSSVAYYFDDGTKVSKNALVASVYSGEHTERKNALINIDKNIDFLKKSNIDTIYQTSDTGAVDAKLTELYYGIRHSLEDGNVSSVVASSEDMLMYLNRRMIITGEVSSFEPKIEMLQAEREKYSLTFGTSSDNVYSSVSGYFYSACDGYENVFTASAAQTMTYEDFTVLTELSPEEVDDTVGKIAYDYTWYLACPVDKTELKDFTALSEYDIIFEANSNTKLTMRLSRIISDTVGDGALLVFMSSDCPTEFHFSRMQPVKIVKSSVSGIKVPIGALRVVDGQSGAYVLYGSKVRFRGFNILAQNENYYIAGIPDSNEPAPEYSPLKVYDNIIVSGKDLYEGKVIS